MSEVITRVLDTSLLDSPAGLWIRIPIFSDPDPAVFLNADPDPAAFLRRIRIQLTQMFEKIPYEEFSEVEKTKTNAKKYKTIKLVQIYCLNVSGSGSRRENECLSKRIRIHIDLLLCVDPR